LITASIFRLRATQRAIASMAAPNRRAVHPDDFGFVAMKMERRQHT
jgi:hypothetical protein